MIETTHAKAAPSAQERSAVGHLIMLVEVAGGTEKVTYECRLPDAGAARRWCEEKVHGATDDTAVLEIQVTEEVWGHRHGWEATASRHIPETLQLGLRTHAGTISWDAPRTITSAPGARRL
jgi:hypothetical protein